ncbi:MAG: DUF547 domain-containing protein [Sphingomonadales bacterium]
MNKLKVALILLLFTLGYITENSRAYAQNNKMPSEIFSRYDKNSNLSFDFSDWSFVLRHTVIRVGASNRYKGKRPRPKTGHRISLANPKPSWLEGNRVKYHSLTYEQEDAILEYKKLVETYTQNQPLSTLSKNAQLSFWLNLYNITVYTEIAKRYPITNLRVLKIKGFWDKKQIMVEGFKLSLNDIQNIVISNWDSPLVIYGLYQGSIGGPNIQNTAFTDENVWKRLNNSAKDFVNSIRGVHKKGNVLRVSTFYDQTKLAFPNFDVDLKQHLLSLSDDKTLELIKSTNSISPNYYDWNITDLYNGYPKGMGTNPSTVSMVDGRTYGGSLVMPIHAESFVSNIITKFKIFGFPSTRVTVDEVEK